MNRRKFAKVFTVILAAILIGACSKGVAIETGETAPDFKLTDTNGRATSLSEFKGKVVILDFFASWCPPCRQEIPDFIALQDTHAKEGFTVVGVSLVDMKESRAFASKMGINYPVLVDDGKAGAAYGPIRSIPTTFIINRDFKIAGKYIGFRPKDIFEKDIKELI